MILSASASPPETSVLSSNQYDLVFYAVVVTAFALFASFLHSVCTKNEVSSRYAPRCWPACASPRLRPSRTWSSCSR